MKTKKQDLNALWKKLEKFEAPWLEQKMIETKQVSSSNEFQELFKEFKKYVVIAAVLKISVPMLSEKVDKVWHQFILFTPHYHKFCDEFLGGYFHHVPGTLQQDQEALNLNLFKEEYESLFGPLHEEWGIVEKDGKLTCFNKSKNYTCFDKVPQSTCFNKATT